MADSADNSLFRFTHLRAAKSRFRGRGRAASPGAGVATSGSFRLMRRTENYDAEKDLVSVNGDVTDLRAPIFAKKNTRDAAVSRHRNGRLHRMKALFNRIERDLQVGKWRHCAVYENELQRFWPLNEKDREIRIAEFAKKYGFRLRFYRKGLCAIFDECPRRMRRIDAS
jgi:hypothetical protein